MDTKDKTENETKKAMDNTDDEGGTCNGYRGECKRTPKRIQRAQRRIQIIQRITHMIQSRNTHTYKDTHAPFVFSSVAPSLYH